MSASLNSNQFAVNYLKEFSASQFLAGQQAQRQLFDAAAAGLFLGSTLVETLSNGLADGRITVPTSVSELKSGNIIFWEDNNNETQVGIVLPDLARALHLNPATTDYESVSLNGLNLKGRVVVQGWISEVGNSSSSEYDVVLPNLYIIITDALEIDRLYKHSSRMGTFQVKMFDNIIQATNKVSEYLKNNLLDNLVFDMHGFEGGIITRHDPYEDSWTRYIDGEDLEIYRTFPSSLSAVKKKDILALEVLLSSVKPNGTCVFLSCSSAKGTSGDKLVNEFHNLNPSITYYVNADVCTVNLNAKAVQIWTGGSGVTTSEELINGWSKIYTNGTLIHLKENNNLTGNIYLDSRNGYQAVNENER